MARAASSVEGNAAARADNIYSFTAAAMLTPRSVADVNGRCSDGLRLARVARHEIEQGRGPATATRTFKSYDALQALLAEMAGELNLIAQTSSSGDLRQAAENCENQVAAEATDVQLSRPIFDRLTAIPLLGLDPNTRQVLKRTLLEFRLAGVNMDAPTRNRIAAVQKEITATGLEFERNVRDDTSETVFDTPAALTGMPKDYLDAHRPGPDGKIHISTAYPDTIPILYSASLETIRRAVYMTFSRRAWPVNGPVLGRLLSQRAELARLLGQPNFAAVALGDKMLSTPAAAQAFIDQANAAAIAGTHGAAAEELARWRKIDPAATAVYRWNADYVDQLLFKEKYDVDADQVRRYFTYARTRDGIFALVHNLFGSDIRPWRTPVWDKDVTAWQIYDGKRLIGRFYLDPFPRPNKYSHASDFPIRRGVGGLSIPLAALVTNFPASGPMDHEDVVTFIHEFGHLLHAMYSGHQRWAADDMSNLENDFIEAPSQFLEEWAWDYPTLARFAIDDQGKPISAELVAKMNLARLVQNSLDARTQIYQSAAALDIYMQPPAGVDPDAIWRRAQNVFGLRPFAEGTHSWASFTHLNGYPAAYYTYVWSKAVAVDLFSRFRNAGTGNRATALAYRRTVLEPGASRPAARLINDFLGRPLRLDAYRRVLGGKP